MFCFVFLYFFFRLFLKPISICLLKSARVCVCTRAAAVAEGCERRGGGERKKINPLKTLIVYFCACLSVLAEVIELLSSIAPRPTRATSRAVFGDRVVIIQRIRGIRIKQISSRIPNSSKDFYPILFGHVSFRNYFIAVTFSSKPISAIINDFITVLFKRLFRTLKVFYYCQHGVH